MPAALHTLGYSGFTPETFAAKLQSAGIEVLIDVRRNPVSRKQGFSKAGLKEFLESRGIEYVHVPELGVPEPLRQELRERGDLGDYFAAFGRYLASCDEVLEELGQRAQRQRCCLMCLEKKPVECHRSVVADELKARSNGELRIEHLLLANDDVVREFDFE